MNQRKLDRIIMDLEDLADELNNFEIRAAIEKLKAITLYDDN